MYNAKNRAIVVEEKFSFRSQPFLNNEWEMKKR
jgi:hypothetical protein